VNDRDKYIEAVRHTIAAAEQAAENLGREALAIYADTNDRDELTQELHEISDHGRDGAPIGSMVCDCDRRAERVLKSGWLRNRDADRWDEGFDAGERDVFDHEEHGFDSPCIRNPYRSTITNQGEQ